MIRRLVMTVCLAAVSWSTFSSAQAQSTHEAIAAVQPQIVKIYGAGGYKNLESFGTGFVVSPDGFIATVWSHLLDAEVVTVVTADGRRHEAELVGAEPRLELALIKIDGAGAAVRRSQATCGGGDRQPGAGVQQHVSGGGGR